MGKLRKNRSSTLGGPPIGGMNHEFTEQIFEIHVFTQRFFVIHVHANLICVWNFELNRDVGKYPF